jgi:uncharacterized protein DUF2846
MKGPNMQKLWMLGLAFLMCFAAGCASGPKFNSVESGFAPLAAGKSRIFFYRPSALGAAIQPDIRLNGSVVGTAQPHGVFFVDPDPGNMEVITGSEVDRKLTFTIGSGETRYVRSAVGLGILVYRIIPELVDEAEARKEMADLSFTGK